MKEMENRLVGGTMKGKATKTLLPLGGRSTLQEQHAEPEGAMDGESFLPSRRGLLRSALVLLLVLSHVLAFMVGYYLTPPRIQTVVGLSGAPPREQSSMVLRLGSQATPLDDPLQGLAMLNLMVEKPGHKIYEVHFSHGLERYELRADFTTQELARRTVRPDGSGFQESWSGTVLERLRRAAGGESFQAPDEPAPTPVHFPARIQTTPP